MDVVTHGAGDVVELPLAARFTQENVNVNSA